MRRRMKRLMIFIMMLATAISALAQELDPRYHNVQEIHDFIFNLQYQYPDRVKVDSVGHSQQDSLPIYLVKISNNVSVDYDRPTVLFVGQLHAEELAGIEIVLTVMEQLASSPISGFRDRRQQLESYFIPTANPEGLNVVFGVGDPDELIYGQDVSYRKNKRSNLTDGIFHYFLSPHGGSDTSGVDINRNFDINWFHGDSLFTCRDHAELWDYYRGPYPNSEAEVQCLSRVCHEIQPLLSTTFHTSRTGDLSEKVFYPWDWGLDGHQDGKLSPDIDVFQDVGENYAQYLDKVGGGHYPATATGGRDGKMHDWMYAEGGWLNMETECSDIQPGWPRAGEIINWVIDGVYYLMDRARVSPLVQGNKGHLKVVVTDPQGQPLVAEVYLPQRHNGYLKPRYTDPVWGVHRRPLLQSNYTVIIRAWGYEPNQATVYVGNGYETVHRVILQPLAKKIVRLGIYDAETSAAMPGTLVLHRAWGIDTLQIDDGFYIRNLPVGDYTMEVSAEGYIPRRFSFTLDQEEVNIRSTLVHPTFIQLDDFEESVPDHWVQGAGFPWGRSGREKHSGLVSLESVPDDFISLNGTGSITATYNIPPGSESLTLTGWRAFELEPDYDSCTVEIAYDNNPFQIVEILNGFSRWHSFFYDLREGRVATAISIRWTINTEATDNDRGLFLDDIALLASEDYVSVNDRKVEVPGKWELPPVYPNPFNSRTQVSFKVPVESHVNLAIYDLLGREVMKLLDRDIASGTQRVSVDMSDFSSGIYFVRMNAPGYQAVQKIVMIK